MKYLIGYGIDIFSKYTAVESCNASNHSPHVYLDMIREIMGDAELDLELDEYEIKYTASYLILQLFNVDGGTLDLEDAIAKGKAHVASHSYCRMRDTDTDSEGNVIPAPVNKDGVTLGKTGKPQKGYKKKRAMELWSANKGKITERKDWIKLFMDEISELSKPVANTYVHNLMSGKW